MENTLLNKNMQLHNLIPNKLSNFETMNTENNAPQTKGVPLKLYEAAATLALLTGAALEGAGLALKEAIDEKKLNPSDAKQIVGNLAFRPKQQIASTTATATATATTGGNSRRFNGVRVMSGMGGSPASAEEMMLNLPPGVQLATDTIIDVANKTKGVVGDGIELAAKKSYEVGSLLLNDAIDAIVPVDLLNKPYSELNPELTQKLTLLTNNLEAMSRDPEARAAIGNLAKATADVGIDAINAAMPNINRLVERVWAVASNVGAKSVRSAINVGLAMLVTALAEVPVVGGVVVGGLEAGTIFNNIVETGSKAVQGFTQIAKDGIEATSVMASSVGASEEKLRAPIEQVKQVYNRFSSTGGKNKNAKEHDPSQNRRRTRSQRLRLEKRLRKSLKAFFG